MCFPFLSCFYKYCIHTCVHTKERTMSHHHQPFDNIRQPPPPHSTTTKTSLAIYSPLFNYLKFVGVFPFKIQSEFETINESTTTHELGSNKSIYLQQVGSKITQRLVRMRLNYERGGSFAMFAKAQLLSFSLETAFVTIQFIRYLLFETISSKIKLGLLLWPATSWATLVMGFKFYLERDRICEIISRVNAIQMEIFGMQMIYKEILVNQYSSKI